MTAVISYNPVLTTNAAGSFSTDTVGLIQGTEYNDPAIRYQLMGGTVATAETLPMWGGVGITALVPSLTESGASGTTGPTLRRSTALTGSLPLTGFTMFTQAHNMTTTPQSPVPLAGTGMGINFYEFGSLARVAVACDPALVSLDGTPVTSQVSWDFVGQRLVPYAPAYNAVTITGATWASTSGGETTFTVGTDLTAVLSAGDDINVTGVVSTGGTGVGFNGAFTVVSVTSTTVVVSQPASSSPGTYSSGGTIVAGGGALPVQVLEVNSTNCMTVSYDSTTGFATWNRSGACALIRI